jgi:hypothetical protein
VPAKMIMKKRFRRYVVQNGSTSTKPESRSMEKTGGSGYSGQIPMKHSSLFENPEVQKYLKKFSV